VGVLKEVAFPYLDRISTLEGVTASRAKTPSLSTASELLLLGRTAETFAAFEECRGRFEQPQASSRPGSSAMQRSAWSMAPYVLCALHIFVVVLLLAMMFRAIWRHRLRNSVA